MTFQRLKLRPKALKKSSSLAQIFMKGPIMNFKSNRIEKENSQLSTESLVLSLSKKQHTRKIKWKIISTRSFLPLRDEWSYLRSTYEQK